MSLCMAEWEDTEFGTQERQAINVPIHGVEQHSELCSVEELEQFNFYELGFESPSRSRANTRQLVYKSEPRSMLVRAVYLALMSFRANPIGRLAPVSDMDSHTETGVVPGAETVALRVRVERELEGWAIAVGEITVTKLDEVLVATWTH